MSQLPPQASDQAAEPACAACGQPLARDSRFCQSCGRAVSDNAVAAPDDEAASDGDLRGGRRRGLLIGLTVLWLAMMVVAFLFIYGLAFQIGVP